MKVKYAVLIGIVLLLGVVLVGGCTVSETAAAEGDTVTVHYTGSVEDGSVFDSSVGGDPLTFIVGDGTMIEGFDEAVRGMEVGKTKTVTIPADKAYGEYDESLFVTFTLEELGLVSAEVGDVITLWNLTTSESRDFTVVSVEGDELILDGNSELVGHDLTFEIEMVSIEKYVEEESAEGDDVEVTFE